jgi:D-apionolactonase
MEPNVPAYPAPLRAGNLHLTLDTGLLRYVRAEERELLRSIYFTLRDENWGTLPFRIANEQRTVSETDFAVRFEATHYQDDTDILRWQVTMVGTSESTLTVSIDGEVLQPFRRNRAGFCVLHPIEECAGQPVRITQPDGTVSHDTYPLLLNPDRFFPYVQAMRWQTPAGATVDLAFAGDAFETEDQRNFGDGSYKTFCTPLARPFPVQLTPGDRIQQRVTLTVNGLKDNEPTNEADPVTLTPSPETYPLPGIGTLYAPADASPAASELAALRALNLAHLRAEIDMDSLDWATTLLTAADQAGQIGAALWVSLTVGATAETQVRSFLEMAVQHHLRVTHLLLFERGTYATPTALLQTAAPLIKAQWPDCQLGAGVQSSYTELARNQFEAGEVDFITYAFQPQEHAFDDLTLIENVESQPSAVQSARAMYPGKRVYVSPITLRKRVNPYALDPASRFTELPVAAQLDSRLGTDFGAGWTLNVLKTAAEAGTDGLTLFRTTGPLGIVQPDELPVYALLRLIGSFEGGRVRPVASSAKLRVNALLLEKDGQVCWLVANHTPHPVSVRGPAGTFILGAYGVQEVFGT